MEIAEIDDRLAAPACRFLERSIGRGITAADFSAVLERRWADGPRGFVVTSGPDVVGAVLTIRSRRAAGGATREFCNLSSLAIDPESRSYAVALLRRAVERPDVVYTNFTASAAVVRLLRAFGFSALPDRERILLPVPFGRDAGVRATVSDCESVAEFVSGDPVLSRTVADHRGTRAKWIGIEVGGRRAAVAVDLVRVRSVPLADVLYCSAPGLFARSAHAVRRACGQAWGFRLLAWSEWQVGRGPVPAVAVRRPRPVMVKGPIAPADVDALYSELTLLPILA